MKKRTDFTLIELLVVIGIIAILAGMLMPALSKAREKGNQVDCLNNNKQLVLAFVMYGNDNKGFFPHYNDAPSGAGRTDGWVYYNAFPVPTKGNFDVTKGILYPYVNSKKVFLCRLDDTGSNLSYGANSDTAGCKFTDADSPSDTPVLLEEGSVKKTTNDGFFNIDYTPRDYVVNRHNKGSIYSFIDGHAAWHKWKNSDVWYRCDFMEPRTNF